MLHSPDFWWAFFYIYFLSCSRFWTFCTGWFAFFYFWWHNNENRENLIDYKSNLFFAMLIILNAALFVAGWIFVNNSHKFSFNTVEFWKKWTSLLSNLAGKGGCYIKVAVTTCFALDLVYFALKSLGCQQSNISNIHRNKTKKQKKQQQQHWAHISLKLTCNIPDIFVLVRHFCCMPTVNHLWIWCSLKNDRISERYQHRYSVIL